MLLRAAERLGGWPSIINLVLIVLLPKGTGGFRPIGLFPTLIRIWMRTRVIATRAWEAANALPSEFGGTGMGAQRAAWATTFAAEAAVTDGIAHDAIADVNNPVTNDAIAHVTDPVINKTVADVANSVPDDAVADITDAIPEDAVSNVIVDFSDHSVNNLADAFSDNTIANPADIICKDTDGSANVFSH